MNGILLARLASEQRPQQALPQTLRSWPSLDAGRETAHRAFPLPAPHCRGSSNRRPADDNA